MMDDRFLQDDPAPLFLAGPIEEAEQSGVRKALSSDLFRKTLLVLAAAATVFAVVWVVNSMLFARVTASGVSRPAPRDNGGQSTPAIQSNNFAQASPATPPPRHTTSNSCGNLLTSISARAPQRLQQ